VGTLNVAAVQMDANLAPTADRLARAGRLVTKAAWAHAQLIVLPELFNTGYAYTEENYHRAEPLDGPTATWMRDIAARLNVHLAGSLMLLDRGEVYNSLLLFAPDGRVWRYDKNYPWGWERGYFCGTRRDPNVTVAETDLGNFGLMICWDIARRGLWRRYAGRVDMMVISSCPPDVSNPTFHFPGGDQVTLDDMGMAAYKGSALLVFDDMLNQQTAWLNVPAVNTVGCGHVKTGIPNGRLSLLGYLPAAPWLVRYLPQADRVQMACEMVHESKVVDASGRVLTKLTKEDGETFTLAEVRLADAEPTPQGLQPASLVPWPLYFLSDVLLPALTRPVYRKGLRRVRQKRVPPMSHCPTAG
jgi:predicted amidohydrolase